MKKLLLHLSMSLCLILSLWTNSACASDRVDELFVEDSYLALEKLDLKRDEVSSYKASLSAIETSLQKTSKGRSIYLKFETIAGSLVAIGIIIGSYKAYFPPGFRAMSGAYVTVTGISHGLIKLTAQDVQKLLADIAKLSKTIKESEKSLKMQINYHCKIISDLYVHNLCPGKSF